MAVLQATRQLPSIGSFLAEPDARALRIAPVNVRQLRESLTDLPDDLPVLVELRDEQLMLRAVAKSGVVCWLGHAGPHGRDLYCWERDERAEDPRDAGEALVFRT